MDHALRLWLERAAGTVRRTAALEQQLLSAQTAVKPAGFLQRLNEALALFLAQDFTQALSRYEKLLRTFPGQAVVWSTYLEVTRPVHASSVGRWRAYEKHLAPILPALDRYCRGLGCV